MNIDVKLIDEIIKCFKGLEGDLEFSPLSIMFCPDMNNFFPYRYIDTNPFNIIGKIDCSIFMSIISEIPSISGYIPLEEIIVKLSPLLDTSMYDINLIGHNTNRILSLLNNRFIIGETIEEDNELFKIRKMSASDGSIMINLNNGIMISLVKSLINANAKDGISYVIHEYDTSSVIAFFKVSKKIGKFNCYTVVRYLQN